MEKQKINMKMECNHFEMSFHSRAAYESDIAATNSKLLIAVVICSYLRFTKTDLRCINFSFDKQKSR